MGTSAYRVMNEVYWDSRKDFAQTVKEYAQQGYTMSAVANLLGYKSHSAFTRLCDKYSWRQWFSNSKPLPSNRIYNPEDAKRMTPPNAIFVEYQGIRDTLAGHAKRLGLSKSVIYRRRKERPDDWEYIFDKRKYVPHSPKANHLWRQPWS